LQTAGIVALQSTRVSGGREHDAGAGKSSAHAGGGGGAEAAAGALPSRATLTRASERGRVAGATQSSAGKIAVGVEWREGEDVGVCSVGQGHAVLSAAAWQRTHRICGSDRTRVGWQRTTGEISCPRVAAQLRRLEQRFPELSGPISGLEPVVTPSHCGQRKFDAPAGDTSRRGFEFERTGEDIH
jgi:hypothetical protein